MAVSKDQYDADLATFTSAVTDYISAVDAFIALPPVVDLSSEDASVQAGITAVADAKGKIPSAPVSP